MTEVDLTTTVAGLTLASPVLTAAGCGGSGRELEPFVDLAGLGGFVTRSVTLDSRPGHPAARVVETPSGLLHATGLQNPGLQGFLAIELPWLAQRRIPTIVSICGSDPDEYAELARRIGESPGVTAVEVNLPGTAADEDRPVDPFHAGRLLERVRGEVPPGVPVLAKLAASNLVVDVARAVAKGGADGVVLADGPGGLALDPGTLHPVLSAGAGTLSGPAMHALAVRCVWRVHRALPDLPVVGVGGVRTGFDALELLAAGARAVQVGSILFADPSAPQRIRDELAAELRSRSLGAVTDVVGAAHREPITHGGGPG